MNRLNYFLILLCFFVSTAGFSAFAEGGKVRYPAVAGAFYPYDQERLSKQIDGYLAGAGDVAVKGDIVGVVAPHAGYDYSGAIAGHAFKPLAGKKYDTVIILGPNHRVYGFRDVAIYKEGFFKTPLGNVPVDSEVALKILNADPAKFVSDPDLQTEEHSLEVMIPFLQRTLAPGFKIVPIMMGDYSRGTIERIAAEITKHTRGKKVLIVASCDLSHDKDYKTACEMDKRALDSIAKMDIGAVEKYEGSGKTEMCGYGPVMVLMHIARSEGVTKGQMLKYANSGDTTGNKEGRIVGYGAVVFAKE
jgi:hypothetical protein